MAKINYKNIVVGVVVGGVDEFLERNDTTNGRADNTKKWQFWGQVGMVGLGLAAQLWGFMDAYGEPVAQSATPLLTKSLSKMLIKPGITAAASSNIAKRYAQPVSSRISQTTQPEFAGQRIY